MGKNQTTGQQMTTTDDLSAITEAAARWQRMQDDLITAQNANIAMAKEFTEREKKFEGDLFNEQQKSAMWERRALDAEHRKDHYMRYCVELLTRLPMLRERAERLEKEADDLCGTIEAILREAKDATFRPNGAAPAPELKLGTEDEARVQALGEALGAGKTGK